MLSEASPWDWAGLGSTSLLTDEGGQYVAGTGACYLPYAGYRIAPQKAPGCCAKPTTELTDHGFTGHKMKAYIKLVDLKARWYNPQISRFIQPDSIVPDNGNPQGLNRYAFDSNNPLKYIDPSRHSWISNIIDKAEQVITKIGFATGRSGSVGKALMVNAAEITQSLRDSKLRTKSEHGKFP